MLVAVDKFTKWVEEAPVTTQDSTEAVNFIKSIIFHFGDHTALSQTMERILRLRSSKSIVKVIRLKRIYNF
jgi:hypothetical protein